MPLMSHKINRSSSHGSHGFGRCSYVFVANDWNGLWGFPWKGLFNRTGVRRVPSHCSLAWPGQDHWESKGFKKLQENPQKPCGNQTWLARWCSQLETSISRGCPSYVWWHRRVHSWGQYDASEEGQPLTPHQQENLQLKVSYSNQCGMISCKHGKYLRQYKWIQTQRANIRNTPR